MKKFLIAWLIIGTSFSVFAQKLTVKSYLEYQKNLLEKAKKFADKEAYRNALYEIITIEGDGSPYLDSLAHFYFLDGEMVSFILVSDELLKRNPDNDALLLQQAIAYEKLGNLKKAVELYEKVFNRQPDNVQLGYILAWDQYQLKRIDEAYATLMKLKDKTFPHVQVQIPGLNNQAETVPLEAAYYNLLGLVSYDLHNLDMASQYFAKALEIHPDFQLAKQNKAAIDLMRQKLNTGNSSAQ